MPAMKARPEWLRATFLSPGAAVDRENNIIRGMVVAQLGPFKSAGRGSFDLESLKQIVQLGNAKSGGLKSRFTHPDMSSDGLGKFLGRVRDLRLETALDERLNKTVPAVRGNLHIDPTALDTPPEGAKALSSSIVVVPDRFIPDGKGGLLKLADDEDPPHGVTPLWRPRVLHASDIVDTGDAVDGLLSAGIDLDRLPLSVLWRGQELLDAVFADQSREVVESRLSDYVQRYLSRRFGEPEPEPPAPKRDEYEKRLQLLESKRLLTNANRRE
jgi:hypothetical protein